VEGEMLDMRKKLALVIFFGIAAVSMLFTVPANASTVYRTKAGFEEATKGYSYYLEAFTERKDTDEDTESLMFGPVNGYSFTVSSIDPLNGDFLGAVEWTAYGLSINSCLNVLQISFNGKKVQAVGGFFWPTNDDYTNVTGTINYLLSDGTAGTIDDACLTTFTGFVADGNTYITNLILSAGDGLYPTINQLYVGSVDTPIPGAVWLLGSGLVGLMVLKRRILRERKRSTSI
jgi:hypothetical protein